MKFNALLFILMSIIQIGHASTLDCSNSNGELHLSEWTYSGGAAPPPGLLIATTQWIYKNQIVYEKKVYEAGDLEKSSESNILWNFNSTGQVYLVNESSGYSTHVVYATQIELKSTDGLNMTGMQVTELNDWFMCQEDHHIYP